ncbi:hypothetical protein TKK_0011750 [Trichogramma kaykai]|uniref:Carbonic anhydrase n=1 Tax=Trichogramma kaykai TaxID=54128 RepID=A0ABD2WRH3_9HYME
MFLWIMLFVLEIALSGIPTVGSMGPLVYDYTQAGQHLWPKDYPNCGGSWQSPVIVAASRSIALPLPALEMVGYRNFLRPPVVMKNNGHTVVISSKKSANKSKSPYIFGAMLEEKIEYEFESFHFHWGIRNSRGSEHVLHGTRYPLEMHLLHRNKKYMNVESALNHEDGLAVLAVFFHLEEEDNEVLKPIIAHLAEVQWINSQTIMNYTFALSSLLPRDLDTFYTYKGSLTSPPCNEAVTWMVFASTVPISFQQMSKFRLLSSGKGILADNYRYLQDLGSRKVYVRRMKNVNASKNQLFDIDVATLKWNWQ